MVESWTTTSTAEPLGIGERLRNAREAKGLSLRTVADLTRIRAVYLKALEDERFGELPGAVYARGFLRTYAGALGLDADGLMDAYPGVFEPVGPALIGTSGVEIPIRPAAPRSRLRIIVTYAAVLLGAGLVAIGIVGYLQLRQFNEPVPPQAAVPAPVPVPGPAEPPPVPAPQPAPPPAQDIPQPVPAPEQGSEPSQPPIATPEPPPPEPERVQPPVVDGVTVEVRTQGTSWLRVTADGERVFQGLMQVGETRTWQGKRRLTIRVGNSPAVQVTVNGRRVAAPAGKRVWEQTFTRK